MLRINTLSYNVYLISQIKWFYCILIILAEYLSVVPERIENMLYLIGKIRLMEETMYSIINVTVVGYFGSDLENYIHFMAP